MLKGLNIGKLIMGREERVEDNNNHNNHNYNNSKVDDNTKDVNCVSGSGALGTFKSWQGFLFI